MLLFALQSTHCIKCIRRLMHDAYQLASEINGLTSGCRHICQGEGMSTLMIWVAAATCMPSVE